MLTCVKWMLLALTSVSSFWIILTIVIFLYSYLGRRCWNQISTYRNSLWGEKCLSQKNLWVHSRFSNLYIKFSGMVNLLSNEYYGMKPKDCVSKIVDALCISLAKWLIHTARLDDKCVITKKLVKQYLI